jgi:TPR repeat protein
MTMISALNLSKVSILIAICCIFILFSGSSLATESKYDSGLVHYSEGNYQAAMDDFYLAVKQGESGAAYMLMLMHAKGLGTPKDKNEAFRWTLVAAQEGMADAQYRAGKMYIERPGIAHAEKQAFFWYSKAVKQGHIEAHYELAGIYQKGLGVVVDKAKAHQLYQYAASEWDVFAQKGDPRAQNLLAGMYERGLGVPMNVALALKWMKRAAVQGSADAQFNLARVLASVEEEDQLRPEEILHWVNQAAKQGHKKALQLRAVLENRWPDFASR